MDTSKSLLSQRVKALLEKGLLGQGTNPEDRRESVLRLTRKGAQVIEASYRTLLEAFEQLLAPLGAKRPVFAGVLDELLSLLRRRD